MERRTPQGQLVEGIRSGRFSLSCSTDRFGRKTSQVTRSVGIGYERGTDFNARKRRGQCGTWLIKANLRCWKKRLS